MSEYLITCPSCSGKNPLFRSVCSKCGTIIRDRVPSIDFWKILSHLIENPQNAFIEIIQAEQKNFATFVLIASLFKIYILSTIIAGVTSSGRFSLFIFFILSSASILVIILTGFIIKIMVNKQLVEFRIKDYYAGISFSFMPQLIGLFIVFVMEFIVFGEQLFTFNPSPFLIKKNFAYLFLMLEFGIIVWNINLTSKLFYIYFGKIFIVHFYSLIVLGLIYLTMNIFL
ncbi:MAG: hypothetical protein M0Q21_07560 [Ignavibacteriaceae bacterium]|nr:hypothetical protein [Ignavibacteriaceae bacterium]